MSETKTKRSKQRKTWGWKGLRFYITVHHQRKDRNPNSARAWRQELIQRPWRGAAHGLAPHDLLNIFLIEPRATRPGWYHPQWAGPSRIKNGLRKHLTGLPTPGSSRGGIFLNWVSLLSDEFSPFPVDTKLSSTWGETQREGRRQRMNHGATLCGRRRT